MPSVARGIDVADLSFVIHHQLPDQLEYYTHRSGRTARAGKKGMSLALVDPKEKWRIAELEKVLKVTFRENFK
jgi:ATP-dependent RNA helicase DeaD